MRAIFISYRREDSEGQAGRLFTDLGRIFGPQSVFMDVAGLKAGRDFRSAIDEQVSTCGVLLAVIGKSWTDVSDSSGRRRLEDPHDFVRLETAAALKRDIPVVPVLVHGAQMPRADQLPPDMADLVYRSALEVTHARWESDVQVLANQLRPYVDVPASAPPASAPAARAAEAPATKGRSLLLAAVVAAAVLLVAGYFYLGPSSGSSAASGTVAPEASPLPGPAAPAPAPTPSPAGDREAEVKAQADAARRVEAAAAAEHRARWPYYDFPPPNAGILVFTITPDGDPVCASYDGSGCLWGQRYDDIDFSKVKTLACGAAHKARWGVTGYEDPMHWCSIARSVRPNRS
ncbi:MAG TPA: toll/interleukin-1 receptor domain-containing protein [Vicinamibacterales bacterium]|nr:toll/interleukin-1 receptor domain-containing protein [Vicinamibacterales bacterium]